MKYILFYLLMPFATLLFAQNQGKVMEGKIIKSNILGKEVKYSIYLPADYDASQRKYPMVYLLHGYSDNETAWVQFGNANKAADELIAKGDISPMIIVMPDAGVSWYINDAEGKTKWMDFFHKEFIPAVEKAYRAKGTSEYRAISGLSMGGYGSLINCLKYPNTFSACAALSAAVWTDEAIKTMPKESYNGYFQKLYGGNAESEGESRLTRHWHENSILDLVKNTHLDTLKKIRWYLDCGDGDFLTEGNMYLHIAMKARGLQHEFRMRDGYHNWDYWRAGIYDALRFFAKGFDRR